MRFPMNTYQGTSRDFFSKWRFLFSHMLRLFQNSFISGEVTYSHFFRVTTSTRQLLFRSSYFFRAAAFFELLLFQNCHFFRRRLNFLLVARCSLLFARCFLLVARCFLLVAQYFLLVARYFFVQITVK